MDDQQIAAEVDEWQKDFCARHVHAPWEVWSKAFIIEASRLAVKIALREVPR